jgi:RNA 2',3'-cyclic 3'-phosphodiesterase
MSFEKRLFIGLELPPSCKSSMAEIDPGLHGLRWLAPEQIHLTLSFLGNVDAADEGRLVEELRGVHVPRFFLPLQGVGVFNARGRPSVVWVGVGRGHPHLFALHQHIQSAVLRSGFEPDLKSFHPHVTVARARDVSAQALQPFLRTHRETDFGLFEVTEFLLYSSVLHMEGAAHRVEFRFPL